MDPIIISVAPNGARKTKAHHPALPMTPAEIAVDAKQCADAGATLLHMHIRDKEGKHSLDAGIYKEAIAATRDMVGDSMIIQCTTESVGMYGIEQQLQMVYDVEPESFSIATNVLKEQPDYENKFRELLEWALSKKIIPQYIVYSPDEFLHFADLRKRGIIPGDKIFILFVLGKKTTDTSNPRSFAVPDDIKPYLELFGEELLPLKGTNWALCAFGGNEDACVRKAVECGGHPRIGFENNHMLINGNVAMNNAALVYQFKHSVKEVGRRIATADEARTLLLPKP